jgi:hypothetical protein
MSIQTIEYRTVDKSTWLRGEWDDECDKKQWTDQATGYACLIVRNQFGALCGYVGIPEVHPCFGMDYDAVYESHESLSVHGNLTFSSGCQSEHDVDHDQSVGVCHFDPAGGKVWWLGFDCAHACDILPAIGFGWGEYRNLAYVTAELSNLAAQLKAVEVAAMVKT